jgi:hypothetical protein
MIITISLKKRKVSNSVSWIISNLPLFLLPQSMTSKAGAGDGLVTPYPQTFCHNAQVKQIKGIGLIK